MTEVTERLDVRIVGRVQGVGFRQFTTHQARRIGVDGWVRNESDGSVRVVAEGSREALEQFLARLKEGPAGSRVENVRPRWSAATGEMSGFTVRFF